MKKLLFILALIVFTASCTDQYSKYDKLDTNNIEKDNTDNRGDDPVE